MRKKFKGPAARAVDAWYRTGNVEANLTDARDLLQSGQDFTTIIRGLKARKHGRDEFDKYPERGSELQGSAFEDKARNGYLRAIDLAFGHDPPVPIRTTWEAGAGNAELEIEPTDGVDHIEVTVRIPRVDITAADEQRFELTDVQTLD